MSTAICEQCGFEYSWHNKRGYKLSDFSCPRCNGKGNAVKRVEIRETTVKICPICRKAGLQYRKAHLSGKSKDHPEYIPGANQSYCPRCDKWVKPIQKDKIYKGDAIIVQMEKIK